MAGMDREGDQGRGAMTIQVGHAGWKLWFNPCTQLERSDMVLLYTGQQSLDRRLHCMAARSARLLPDPTPAWRWAVHLRKWLHCIRGR